VSTPRTLFVAVCAALLGACAAVFPELSTRFDKAPAVGTLDPPPPEDRHFVRVVKGRVPPRARDGRTWDQAFGSLPDPYVRVFVNDKELMKTKPASDTLEPAWDASQGANYAIQVGDKVEVQLWDSNPLNDGIIGKKEFRLEAEQLGSDLDLELSGECGVTMAVLPAKAVWGAGFWYELRRGGARVTRVVDASPASRAGLQKGDEIVMLDGKPIETQSVDEVRSTLGAIPTEGVPLTLRHPDGTTLQATVKEGPIYPLFSDYATLPVVPD
jgi:hypothetical protein